MAASAQDLHAQHSSAIGATARFGENFASYLRSLDELVDAAQEDLPQQVAEKVRDLVSLGDWLPEDCCEPGEDCYRRHLLYADPAGRFTVLAVVWSPGHTTPVHGHTAWGAVGVYQGNPSVEAYCCSDGCHAESSGVFCCKPGEVSYVTEGTQSPHRVFNDSDDIAITIHTYGRDLRDDPACINILL